MGGLEESYCLKWNDFHTSVTASFAELRKESDLFDITLICEGRPIMAHKLILSACSQVFKQMLKSARNAKEPTILLWNIKHHEMEALLNFMYYGEVNVTQDKLNHFLDLAEKLKVRGLTSNGEKEKHNLPKVTLPQQPIRNPLLAQKAISISNPVTQPGTSLLNPLLKKTFTERSAPSNGTQDESNDQFTIKNEINKTESSELLDTTNTDMDDEDDGDNPMPVMTEMQTDENSADGFDPSAFLTNESNDEASLGSSSGNLHSGLLPSLSSHFIHDSPAMQTNQIEPIVAADGTKEFPCQYCDKRYLTRSRLKRHVLDVHEKGEYPCPDCGKIFSSTRRLKDHQRSRYCHGVSRVIIS